MARSQVFFFGGAFGERSEPTRPKQLRSERSEQAVAGVWGRSPQRGPGGRSPPEKFREIGCFRRHLALKKFVLCRTAIN